MKAIMRLANQACRGGLTRHERARLRQRGLSLLEVVIAGPIVAIALGMFVQMLGAGVNLRSVVREEWIASAAAQDAVERMRNEEFRDVARLFNMDPLDDPGGPGTGPGPRFFVRGLQQTVPGADGLVGEILLPITNAGTEVAPDCVVREDLVNDDLGTPRDLNGDCVVDGLNHNDDYTLMPVIVRLRWQGKHGARQFELYTSLAELRE